MRNEIGDVEIRVADSGPGISPEILGSPVRSIRDDEEIRHRPGTSHQPYHCEGARRYYQHPARRAAWRQFPCEPAGNGGRAPMKNDVATVIVVDDDAGVRNSMRILLKSVGLNCTLFASAQEFLGGLSTIAAGMPGSRHPHAGHERARAAARIESAWSGHPGHLHDRARRHSHGGRSDAAWRFRFPAEAIPRAGPARSHSARDHEGRRVAQVARRTRAHTSLISIR